MRKGEDSLPYSHLQPSVLGVEPCAQDGCATMVFQAALFQGPHLQARDMGHSSRHVVEQLVKQVSVAMQSRDSPHIP